MTLARFGRIVRQRLRSVTGWRAADTALDDEVAFHLEQLTAEKIALGLAPGEAAAAAAREFGNRTRVVEESRGMRGFTWWRDLMADLRHGGRALRRSPLFTIIAVTSLGVGIGSAVSSTKHLRGGGGGRRSSIVDGQGKLPPCRSRPIYCRAPSIC